jgi:predicted nucleic acid-binding protein
MFAGSGLQQANALLQKFGIEKFFGVKNVAAFESALETALKAGLSSKDATILATAKAQGTALATNDKAVIRVAKQMGLNIK